MAEYTTSGRTVFVLGKEINGNHEAIIAADSEEYTLDPATIVTYSSGLAEFPYSV
jgi:hypothetical protein